MIWFILHNIIKQFSSLEVQTRNLAVFLIGVTSYTLLYSWLGSVAMNSFVMDSFGNKQGSFVYILFNFFSYIILADGLSMAIIYKNYFSRSIFKEVEETLIKTPEEKRKETELNSFIGSLSSTSVSSSSSSSS